MFENKNVIVGVHYAPHVFRVLFQGCESGVDKLKYNKSW